MATAERKYNLDLLRILSMIFVVCLHYLGVGGGYYNILDGDLSKITVNFVSASLLEALAIVGVNCFVLISGYFLITSSFKPKKILDLWFNTIFYTVILFIIYVALFGFGLNAAIKSAAPILMSTYWFITVYIALYLVSPFINKLCENITQKQHLTLIAILVGIFSVWKSIMPIASTIDDRKGYSLTWFIVLYLIGAYARKYGLKLFKNNWNNLLAYFAISAFSVSVKLAAIVASTKFSVLAEGQNLFYHYDSITVLAAAVFLFVFFSRLEITSAKVGKVVGFIAPSVFSVYIIHENFLWREWLWNKALNAGTMKESPLFVLHLIACVALVFVSCILIDKIRIYLFRLVPRTVRRAKEKSNG